MWYGWNNSITIMGWVGYTPHVFKNSLNKDMVVFDVMIPRYSFKPKREGEANEVLEPLVITVMGGASLVKMMKKRRVMKGDAVCVSGALNNFKAERNGVVYKHHFVDASNIVCMKGYIGMKAIEITETNNAIYDEILKEIKLQSDPGDITGNNQ